MLVILGNSTRLNPFLLQKGIFFFFENASFQKEKIFYENAVSLYLKGQCPDYAHARASSVFFFKRQ